MKGKAIKKDQKELDAQKQLEEQKRREEEEQKLAQEQLKYQIISLESGLEMVITQWCLDTLWLHPTPKEFVKDFVCHFLQQKSILDRFENIDLLIISEYILYNLIFAKETLGLDQEASWVLINIQLQVLMHNNPIFDIEGQGEKDKSADLVLLKELLGRHSLDHKYIQKEEDIISILEYMRQGYFNHFELYRFVFACKQPTQEITITVNINRPLVSEPLCMAKSLDRNSNDNEQEQLIRKQAMEKMLKEEEEKKARLKQKEEEEERLRREEEDKLDPRTQEIIRVKVAEAQAKMEAYLQEREETFQAKLEAMPIKKK